MLGRGVARNSKKRPREESPDTGTATSPDVFFSPGLKPDTRFTVFEKEYHVHSVILKLHSNYFRRFLDSPDKEAAPVDALFKYDYVSVVDKDGSWALDPVSKVCFL